MQKGQSVFLKA